MQDQTEPRPGASGRRWEARFRAARDRRGGGQASKFEQRIARGAAGEELLGRELTALAQEMELGVLHDLALPGGKANIDHLVIGPAGVTVVDAKTWTGRVSFGRDTLWQGRRNRHKQLEGVVSQIERVRTALAAADCHEVPVEGLVCMVNANSGVPADRLRWVSGVGVGTIPNVRRHVARTGALERTRIRTVHDVLAQRFVVSGGGFQPSLAPPGAVVPPPVSQVDEFLRKLNEENRRDEQVRRRRRLRRRLLVAAAGLLLLVGALASRPRDDAPATPLTRAELTQMTPALRAAATQAAGGRVRGPAVQVSRSRFVLRYRRGRCRIRVAVDRVSRARSVTARGCKPR